jgi:hypothetical protein
MDAFIGLLSASARIGLSTQHAIENHRFPRPTFGNTPLAAQFQDLSRVVSFIGNRDLYSPILPAFQIGPHVRVEVGRRSTANIVDPKGTMCVRRDAQTRSSSNAAGEAGGTFLARSSDTQSVRRLLRRTPDSLSLGCLSYKTICHVRLSSFSVKFLAAERFFLQLYHPPLR